MVPRGLFGGGMSRRADGLPVSGHCRCRAHDTAGRGLLHFLTEMGVSPGDGGNYGNSRFLAPFLHAVICLPAPTLMCVQS